MDAGLAWTVVGSIAGVAAVVAGVVFGVLQLWQGRGNSRALADDDPLAGADRETARVLLPPPVGRLPEVVRGRDDLVGVLAGLASVPDGRVHVLAGLGGCGKSTVALAVAARARESVRRVWWVPAVDQASVTGLLLGLARQLGAADGEVQEAL